MAKKTTRKSSTKKPTRKKSAAASSSSAKKKRAKKSTKKKAKKPAAAAAPKPSPEVVAEVFRHVVLEARREDELPRLMRTFDDDPELAAALAIVRERTLNYANREREEQVGTALARLDHIYRLATGGAEPNLSAAIQSQAHTARLLALYPRVGEGEVQSAAPRDAGARDELDQVEEHLRPLGLAPPEYPISGVARICADTLRQLQAAQNRGSS